MCGRQKDSYLLMHKLSSSWNGEHHFGEGLWAVWMKMNEVEQYDYEYEYDEVFEPTPTSDGSTWDYYWASTQRDIATQTDDNVGGLYNLPIGPTVS